jgi:hypothetical protein
MSGFNVTVPYWTYAGNHDMIFKLIRASLTTFGQTSNMQVPGECALIYTRKACIL